MSEPAGRVGLLLRPAQQLEIMGWVVDRVQWVLFAMRSAVVAEAVAV